MPVTSACHVRPVEAQDEPAWRRLWTGYLRFYEAAVPERVYAATFARLLSDDPWMPSAFLAFVDGEPSGLVHYLYHAHCWREERVCYLQDLFADPDVRGRGVGRALIERVYAQADADGAGSVYWLTQDFNTEARRLYDRVAAVTPFVKYQRQEGVPASEAGA